MFDPASLLMIFRFWSSFGLKLDKIWLTRGALSREHAYATIAFLEHLHHYFSTYKLFWPSYYAYAMFVNKTSLFSRISNFRALPLGPHRPHRASTSPPHDSPFHSENFKPNYTSLAQLEAEIWRKTCFWPFRRPWPWPLTFRTQKLIVFMFDHTEYSLKVWAKSDQ